MNPAASLFNVTGKAAIVTGASYGLGVTMAETLAQAGARVALVARSVDKLQRVAESIKKQGGTAEVVTCDVGDSAQVANMFARILQKFGRVDILVNNAGVVADARASPRRTVREDGADQPVWRVVLLPRSRRLDVARWQRRLHHQHRLDLRAGGLARQSSR